MYSSRGRSSTSGRASAADASSSQRQLYIVLGVGLVAGYILGMVSLSARGGPRTENRSTGCAQQQLRDDGATVAQVIMETADVMFTTGAERGVRLDTSGSSYVADQSRQQAHEQHHQQQEQQQHRQQQQQQSQSSAESPPPKKQTPGDTIHSLLTSNGSPVSSVDAASQLHTHCACQCWPHGMACAVTRCAHSARAHAPLGPALSTAVPELPGPHHVSPPTNRRGALHGRGYSRGRTGHPAACASEHGQACTDVGPVVAFP